MVVDCYEKIKQNIVFKDGIRTIEQTAPNHIALYDKNKINQEFFLPIDLTMMSVCMERICRV